MLIQAAVLRAPIVIDIDDVFARTYSGAAGCG